MGRKVRDKPSLKQDPRAWYESFTKKKFIEKGYKRGCESGIMIAQIYVDDLFLDLFFV